MVESLEKKKSKQDKTSIQVHPVTEVALRALSKGEDNTLLLSSTDAARVVKALDEYLEKPTLLVEAVQALLALAYYLDTKRNSAAASAALLDIAKRAIPALEKMGVDMREVLDRDNVERSVAGAQFQEMLGQERYKADPRMEKPTGGPGGLLGILSVKDK